MRMRHIVFGGLPDSAVFFHIINCTIFGKEKQLSIKWYFDFLCKRLSEIFLILRKIERDMIKKSIGLHVKFPVFLSDFDGT
jgi:hypothetical protein